METSLVYVQTIIIFILLIFSWAKFKRDFASPSVVTLFVFLISYICYSYNVDKWTVVFTYKALFLFTGSFVLMITFESLARRKKIRLHGNKTSNMNSVRLETLPCIRINPKLEKFLLLFYVASTLFCIGMVLRGGYNLGASGLSAIGVYKETGEQSGVQRLLFNMCRFISYTYMLIFVTKVFYHKEKVRRNLKAIFVIGLMLLNFFFSGQRSALLGYIFTSFVMVGVIVQDVRRTDRKVNIKKLAKRAVIIGIIGIVFFVLSRNVVKGNTNQEPIIQYITYYFGSPADLMSRIVEQPDLCHNQFVGYFGEKTFFNFWLDLFSYGIVEKAPASRRWISMGGIFSSGYAGNEFSFFCGPYVDFGLIGSFVFFAIEFYVFSYVYYQKIMNAPKTKKRYTTLMVYTYMFVIFPMSFFQDTISTLIRPILLLYIIFIHLIMSFLVKLDIRKKSTNIKKENYDQ